jgi:hypothetical protein
MAEKCVNKERCNHARCEKCYNLNPRGKIFEQCEGIFIKEMGYLAWCLEDLKDGLLTIRGFVRRIEILTRFLGGQL